MYVLTYMYIHVDINNVYTVHIMEKCVIVHVLCKPEWIKL